MKTILPALTLALLLSGPMANAAEPKTIPNRMIDYKGFVQDATKLEKVREEHRVTEAEFLKMMEDPTTIVLDARSAQKFALRHIKGAKNLSLPDMTADDLARVIPNKDTRVIIYCNNNFENAPVSFPGKAFRFSLNIFTFNSLAGYGYTNVYELGPLIDIQKSILPFEGTEVGK